MASNQAAFLDSVGQELRVGPADMPKVEKNEVIIRSHAVAVNPLDWKQQASGFFIDSWPRILGLDIAGEVVEVGADVSDLRKGDRVVTHSATLRTQNNRNGGFQNYTVAPAEKAAKIPDSISYAEGSVIPVAFDTAVTALFGSGNTLHLPEPSLQPKPSGKTIVLWGASSSVGAIASQLAAAAGVTVIATASPHNFEFAKKNGVSHVFDHRTDSVVDDVVQAVKASGGEFAGVFDTISLPDQSFNLVSSIIQQLGGGTVMTTLPGFGDVPDNVKVYMVHAESAVLGPALRKSFLKPALEKGLLKPSPDPLIVGKGLEAAQKGMDLSKKGVSAKKIVIEL